MPRLELSTPESISVEFGMVERLEVEFVDDGKDRSMLVKVNGIRVFKVNRYYSIDVKGIENTLDEE